MCWIALQPKYDTSICCFHILECKQHSIALGGTIPALVTSTGTRKHPLMCFLHVPDELIFYSDAPGERISASQISVPVRATEHVDLYYK